MKKISKRQFLKISASGTSALLLAPVLRSPRLLASPVVLPPGYLESTVHANWMKLCYNDQRESRQTRRRVGVGLRNIGAVKGRGLGAQFVEMFDAAVTRSFQRFLATRETPGSTCALVQTLYDETIYPSNGPEAGRVLFGTLLAMLRGRDGSEDGETAHQLYLSYRAAALAHKDLHWETSDPGKHDAARRRRALALQAWQNALNQLTEDYATRKRRMNADLLIPSDALDGFHIYSAPVRVSATRLVISRDNGNVVVRWEGDARLQTAPDVSGPWEDAQMTSPALFEVRPGKMFFRTVESDPGAE